MFTDYIFVFKDSTEHWRIASNPVFIARHTYCRAIPRKEIDKLNFDTNSDFVYALNSEDKSRNMIELIAEFDLY